jgi:exopolyphosphatase / guanosine-5'-triphosphate,3'-diphosphate pyrophosphatase
MVNVVQPLSQVSVQPPAPGPAQDSILAAIDVGTNSIHMVVVRVQPSIPGFTIIAREKEAVRLGDRDLESGNLTLAAMERATAALRRCQDLAQSLHAKQIVGVATSAVREAPNGREFLKSIAKELGLEIDLISGPEEARRIYLGVVSGMDFNHQLHVVIDIGGGSTELILGTGDEPISLNSTKVGAVRLTQDFISTDPVHSTELAKLQAYVRGMLERAVEDIQAHIEPGVLPRFVGTSGTIEALAVIHAREKLGVVPSPLHGYEMSLKDIRELVNRLRKIPLSERLLLPGMNERRADIIVAGAIVLQEAMELLKMQRITICERALREGVVVDWMLTHGLIENRLRSLSSVRRCSVWHTAQKYHVNLKHAERVAGFALALFDQTQGELHTWKSPERELLWAAAILHNVGHFVGHSSHHKHSYYLIRNGELLGYTETEVETIANLARYHRKSSPKKRHESYRNLTSKDHRKVVDQLSPILRLAVALDRRQVGAIQRIVCYYSTEPLGVDLHVWPTINGDDCELELWSLNYKKPAFESEFNLPLRVHFES